ncbi:MAG: carbon-nitrogen hydrolase family protein [Pikeienuella sp.]
MQEPKETLSILACQINIPAMTTVAERDAHLALSAQKVGAKLTEEPAQLVVLPELSTIDYARETFDNLDELAERLDGPSFQCWAKIAQRHNCHIAYSFPRRDGDQFHICLAVAGPDGELVGHYDKIHLAQYGASMEKDYFTRGNHLMTFSVGGFKLAPIICYDIRIPELSRALIIDHGVNVILHCGAYYRDESFATWHDFAVTRALENQTFLLSLNRAGENYGASINCAPWMDENTLPAKFADHAEDFRQITLFKSDLTDARRDYSFLSDRLKSYQLPVVSG